MVIKMKKILIIILSILILILIGLGIYTYYNKNKKTDDNKKYPYYHEILLKEFKKKIDNKDTFIIVIHQTGCPHCNSYLPVVKTISNDYKLDIYSINTTNLSEDEYYSLTDIIHYSGTPTTAFFIDGEETTSINRIVGTDSQKNVIERFKSLGFIKE